MKMNGLDAILETIQAEARAEAETILAEARARAAALQTQGVRDAAAQVQAMEQAAADEAAAIRARGASAAAMASRRILLAARRRAVTELVDAALASLAAWPAERKARLYADFLATARGGETVICNADDVATGVAAQALELAARARAAADLPPLELTLSPQAGDFVGGLILRRGRIDDNLTFEMLTRQSREALEVLAAARLAEQQADQSAEPEK